MQIELKEIQRDVGITFVFVTHDQEEALTMSDRIAVFNEGRIEQLATPGRALRAARPRAFVAGFVGTSNLLEGAAAAELVGEPRHLRHPAREGPDARRRTTAGRGRRDLRRAHGVVREVVYLGCQPPTRSSTSTPGATLTVAHQNSDRSHRRRPRAARNNVSC